MRTQSYRWLIGAAVLAIATAAFGQWPRIYDNPEHGDDIPSSIAVDSAGNIIVIGMSIASTNSDYQTIKYRPNGTVIWKKRFSSTNGGASYDAPTAVTTDALNNVYVTGGSTNGSSVPNFLTIKYDAAGNMLWNRRLPGVNAARSFANSIAVNDKFEVGIAGTANKLLGTEMMIASYDSSGNLLWRRVRSGTTSGQNEGIAIRGDHEGNWYLFGTVVNVGSQEDFALFKFNSTTGAQVWTRRYNGSGNSTDTAVGMELDSLGNIVVTGTSLGPSLNPDIATVKYDPNGNRLWVRRLNSYPASELPYNDHAVDLVIDADDNVIVVGDSGWDVELMDYLTLKYSPSGELQWSRRYTAHKISGGSNDYAKSVDVDSDGNVFVTGTTQGDPAGIFMDYDFTTIKYSPTGVRVWVKQYENADPHADDFGTAVAVDRATGRVYVTGIVPGSASDGNIATIRY